MERFFNKIEVLPNQCWQWRGHIKSDGYTQFYIADKIQMKAHKFSYLIFNGEIKDGLQIDHLCSNRSCVNPDHLEAVTARENTYRSPTIATINAQKTHCPQGHPYDKVKSNGYRLCTICIKYWNDMKTRRNQLKKKEQ